MTIHLYADCRDRRAGDTMLDAAGSPLIHATCVRCVTDYRLGLPAGGVDRVSGGAPESIPATINRTHVLSVFNAVDVPEDIAAQVLILLGPYDADCYTRVCDATGRPLT